VATEAQSRLTGGYRHRVLLALLILSWAVSWPLIKVGVATVPPIWYACFRYWIATVCLFALVALRREGSIPPRGDWPVIAVSGVCQMAAYSALTAFALTILPPGRASVLAFSTPIWVVPLAAWWLHERASPAALLGMGLGLVGALAIAAPALHLDDRGQVIAYGMLLGAAVSWAISIVAVRAHRFTSATLALAPWQTLVAACLLLPVALVAEGAPGPIGISGAASLAFVGPVATAFAYWAVVEAGRHFTAGTLSIALLATPPAGILLSALTLGETVGPSLVAGAALIATGIRLAVPGTKSDGKVVAPSCTRY
jgi:drug/metabolite transporter (DMT)-like permease